LMQYLFGNHMIKLVLRPFQRKEWSDYEGTSRRETDCKLLGYYHHDWQEYRERNEN
jgi:hypothetical protein